MNESIIDFLIERGLHYDGARRISPIIDDSWPQINRNTKQIKVNDRRIYIPKDNDFEFLPYEQYDQEKIRIKKVKEKSYGIGFPVVNPYTNKDSWIEERYMSIKMPEYKTKEIDLKGFYWSMHVERFVIYLGYDPESDTLYYMEEENNV